MIHKQSHELHCNKCNTNEEVMLDPTAVERRNNGELTQDCFPALTNDQRELMISNTCGKCWKKLMTKIRKKC